MRRRQPPPPLSSPLARVTVLREDGTAEVHHHPVPVLRVHAGPGAAPDGLASPEVALAEARALRGSWGSSRG